MTDRYGNEKHQTAQERACVSSIMYNRHDITIGQAISSALILFGGLLPKTRDLVLEMCNAFRLKHIDEQVLSHFGLPHFQERDTRTIHLSNNVSLRLFPLEGQPVDLTARISVTDDGLVTARVWPFAYICATDGTRSTPDLKFVTVPCDQTFELGMLPERLMYVPILEGLSNTERVFRARGMKSEVREIVFATLQEVEAELDP